MIKQKVKKLILRVFLILFLSGFYKLTIIACSFEISIPALKENHPDTAISIFGYNFDEKKTKAIIVIRNDSVLFEHCYPGYSETLKKASPLFERLTALSLLGIALKEGYIYSINEPVTKYLPELPEKDFSNVNLAQLLNLNGSNNEFNLENFPEKLLWTQDKEKDTFNYITKLCCLITKRATGVDIKEYFDTKLNAGDEKYFAPVRNGCLFPEDDTVSTCGFIFKHNDWYSIARLYLLLGIGDNISISHNGLSLHLSRNEQLIIIWIGN